MWNFHETQTEVLNDRLWWFLWNLRLRFVPSSKVPLVLIRFLFLDVWTSTGEMPKVGTKEQLPVKKSKWKAFQARIAIWKHNWQQRHNKAPWSVQLIFAWKHKAPVCWGLGKPEWCGSAPSAIEIDWTIWRQKYCLIIMSHVKSCQLSCHFVGKNTEAHLGIVPASWRGWVVLCVLGWLKDHGLY